MVNASLQNLCSAYSLLTRRLGRGFDAQVNGAVLSIPAFRRDFGEHFEGDFVVPAPWLSAFNSISSVGQFFGGFLCSAVADRVGRRLALAVGVVISCGGIFGELFSTARVAFLISKLILGVGLGFYLTIGPLYSSEVSPTIRKHVTNAITDKLKGFASRPARYYHCRGESGHRDRPVALQRGYQGLWRARRPVGIPRPVRHPILLRGYVYFQRLMSDRAGSPNLTSVFLGLGLPFSVESPWYLVRHNRIDDARNALQRLYGAGTNVETKLVAIRMTVAQDLAATESKWSDAIRGPNLLRTTISCGVFVCQHLVGIIFVLGFSAYFFQLAGLPTERSFDLGVGVTACGVVGTIISWLIVNRLGRRLIFNSGMAILSTINLLIGILDVVPTSGASWTQAALTVVWAFFYQVSIGAVAFVLLGETSSPSLRAKTTAMATATQAVFGIVMNIVIPYMVNPDEGNMQGKVGFVFGGLGVVATVLCYLYIPDLKDRTFEEIDLMFEARVPPRNMGRYVIER